MLIRMSNFTKQKRSIEDSFEDLSISEEGVTEKSTLIPEYQELDDSLHNRPSTKTTESEFSRKWEFLDYNFDWKANEPQNNKVNTSNTYVISQPQQRNQQQQERYRSPYSPVFNGPYRTQNPFGFHIPSHFAQPFYSSLDQADIDQVKRQHYYFNPIDVNDHQPLQQESRSGTERFAEQSNIEQNLQELIHDLKDAKLGLQEAQKQFKRREMEINRQIIKASLKLAQHPK